MKRREERRVRWSGSFSVRSLVHMHTDTHVHTQAGADGRRGEEPHQSSALPHYGSHGNCFCWKCFHMCSSWFIPTPFLCAYSIHTHTPPQPTPLHTHTRHLHTTHISFACINSYTDIHEHAPTHTHRNINMQKHKHIPCVGREWCVC